MARRLIKEAHRALAILVDSPDGANEALLVYGHGFKRQTLAGLVRAGFATVERDVVETGEKTIEIVRVRITAAGRQAIEA
jgi:plasmid stabilization system protein ParE